MTIRSIHNDRGTTLVETVVVMVILMIVLLAVGSSLTFAVRIMGNEKTISSADTLNATIRNVIEDDLRYADSATVEDGGNTVTFKTSKSTTYLTAGTYSIYNDPTSKRIWIRKHGSGGSPDISGALLPSYTYPDNMGVTCTFSKTEDAVEQISIVTSVDYGSGTRDITSHVTLLNGKQVA